MCRNIKSSLYWKIRHRPHTNPIPTLWIYSFLNIFNGQNVIGMWTDVVSSTRNKEIIVWNVVLARTYQRPLLLLNLLIRKSSTFWRLSFMYKESALVHTRGSSLHDILNASYVLCPSWTSCEYRFWRVTII
jgi:hypothetical protein